jgi:hypothetical protein
VLLRPVSGQLSIEPLPLSLRLVSAFLRYRIQFADNFNTVTYNH